MIKTMQRTVSAQVAYLLPEVVIEYLWDLATQEEACSHTLILKKQMLGGKVLQGIWHITDDVIRSAHKVFGFEPLNVAILITVQGGEMYMESAGLLEAVGLTADVV